MDIQEYLDIIIERRLSEECDSVDYLRKFSGDHESVLRDFVLHEKCQLEDVIFTVRDCGDLISKETSDYIIESYPNASTKIKKYLRIFSKHNARSN